MRNIWQQYTDVLHSKGIRPPCDRWYVVRAEAFLRAHQGKPLRTIRMIWSNHTSPSWDETNL